MTASHGRDPRVERSRIVVLNAAQALLGERGYDAFTVEAVVARSGVAKTTIYRHWRNRTELLHDVLSSAKPARAVKTTGDLERDLNNVLQGVAAATDRDVYLRSMPSLVAAAQHDPELRELHDRLAEERSEGLEKLLLAAQSRGELRDDCDIELITHTLIGLVFVRRIFRRLPVDASQIAELVSTVLHGAAAVQ